MSKRGIYLHIPFCLSKCPYCDFYSAPGSDALRGAYTDALISAIDTAPWEFDADTLYIGGGTPTALSAEQLLALLAAAKRRFLLPGAEYTVEANPGTVTRETLAALCAGGFTRISFGVQSLDDGVLRTLGRRHTAREAEDAILAAADAGFSHISADLMLAVPGQTPESAAKDALRLASLPVDHLSAYLLHVEEGTPFCGKIPEPDADFAADCYEAVCKALRETGFLHYEISNFARDPRAVSRHNLHYWRCEEYLGVGAAAHSFLNGRRFFFPRERDAFLKAETPWSLCVDDGAGGSEEERILLALRLREGIALSSLSDKTADTLRRKSVPLVSGGFVTLDSGALALTERGFLVSNEVIAALL